MFDLPVEGVAAVTNAVLSFTSSGEVVVNGTRVTVCTGDLSFNPYCIVFCMMKIIWILLKFPCFAV